MEREGETWDIRHPWDLRKDEDDTKKLTKKGKNRSVPVKSSPMFTSFLDPHDIDALGLSSKAAHAKLTYPTPACVWNQPVRYFCIVQGAIESKQD